MREVYFLVRSSHIKAIEGGIYDEDMAVAILDEVEEQELAYKYLSRVSHIRLGRWWFCQTHVYHSQASSG